MRFPVAFLISNLESLSFRNWSLFQVLSVMLFFLGVHAFPELRGENEWPNWRGPLANGTNPAAKPPRSWGPDSNIAWKVRVPGSGSSTPIVWGNQVIVLTSEEVDAKTVAEAEMAELESDVPGIAAFGTVVTIGQATPDMAKERYLAEQKLTRASKRYRFSVVSYDLESGEKKWETDVVRQFPHEPCHATNSFASASPVTDGKHIYAFFGSRGLFCLDMQGVVKWQYSLGRMQTLGSFGEGASPAVYDDYVIVPWDHEGDSCLMALNAKNGYVKWKVSRQERTNWATPIVVNHKNTNQVIVNGRTVRSYKLETGELLWSCPGQTEQAIPTPLANNGRVFVTSGLRGWACFAISLDAEGVVPENSEYVHWTLKKQTPYVPSPCSYNGNLYLYHENSRTISIINEENGEAVLPPKRLMDLGDVYASLGVADGMLFLTDRAGKTLVLDAKSLETVSENSLDETINASLVFVGERILARSSNHLICLKAATPP
jgi:outer membrane protein assembly factor BamB